MLHQSTTTPDGWQTWLDASVADLHNRSLFRTLRPTIPGTSAIEVQIPAAELYAWINNEPLPTLSDRQDFKTIKLFSLNDYLGLSTHPKVRAAAATAAQRCGNGPRSSALVGGYTCYHRDLETSIAELKGTQDALLFPTGFAANVAVVAALAAAGDIDIFSDELNHASIVDGARLGRRGGSNLHVYRHNNLAHLESLLIAAPSNRKKLVITDSLFSMDGDFADLKGLAALRQKYGFLFAVDEAHATLVCGPKGEGAAAAAGVEHAVDLHIGTLSKAFGCLGGFVACSAQWKGFFVNKGRAQVFSTSLPVPVVASAQAALRVACEEPWRRDHLNRLIQRVGTGLDIVAQSPIIPVIIGPEDATMAACSALLGRGFHVPGIRPPTVPAGTSRLRLSLSAGHSTEDVDALVAAVKEVCFGNEGRKWIGQGGMGSGSGSGAVQLLSRL